RNTQPLALAAGQRRPPLADYGVVSMAKLAYEFVTLRHAGSRVYFLVAGIRPPISYVVHHRPAKQADVLRNNGNAGAQTVLRHLRHGCAVDQHLPLLDVVKTLDQA